MATYIKCAECGHRSTNMNDFLGNKFLFCPKCQCKNIIMADKMDELKDLVSDLVREFEDRQKYIKQLETARDALVDELKSSEKP